MWIRKRREHPMHLQIFKILNTLFFFFTTERKLNPKRKGEMNDYCIKEPRLMTKRT